MPIYKQKCALTLFACPQELSGICETNGVETAFFIPFPSVCSPLTLTTQQGTHVMHHAMISDSKVEVITLGSQLNFFSLLMFYFLFFPSSFPSAPTDLSGSTLLCQPSIWWLETTHFVVVTCHDGPARPEPLDRFPSPCSSEPLSERQSVGTLGESIDPPRVDDKRRRPALFSSGTFFMSVDLVIQQHQSVTKSETLSVGELAV